MILLISSQFCWLRGSVNPDDGSLALLVGSSRWLFSLALLVGFDAGLMILCGADVLTDRWFRLVIRLLASMARFTSTVAMMSPLGRKLCGLVGALKSVDGAWIVL
jgi:hypothetical protein